MASILPESYNFTVRQGVPWSQDFTLKDALTGLPINLTGYHGISQVRTKASSQTVLADINVLVYPGEDGNINMSISGVTADTLPPISSAVYDLYLLKTGDDSATMAPLAGSIQVQARISKEAQP